MHQSLTQEVQLVACSHSDPDSGELGVVVWNPVVGVGDMRSVDTAAVQAAGDAAKS